MLCSAADGGTFRRDRNGILLAPPSPQGTDINIVILIVKVISIVVVIVISIVIVTVILIIIVMSVVVVILIK